MTTLRERMNKALDNAIDAFIKNEDDETGNLVRELWYGKNPFQGKTEDELLAMTPEERAKHIKLASKASPKKPVVLKPDTDLMKLSVVDLKALCKDRQLKISGTKRELIERLEGKNDLKESTTSSVKGKVQNEEDSDSGSDAPPAKKTKAKKDSKVPPVVVALSKKESASEPIVPNKFKNLEFQNTGLIFNRETKSIYGMQLSDGTVRPLNAKDIELCKKYNLPFTIPMNLSVSASNASASSVSASSKAPGKASSAKAESDSESDIESDDELVIADSDDTDSDDE